MKIKIGCRKNKKINDQINSYDLIGFNDLGTWFNAWGVSYIGSVTAYLRLTKQMDLTPFKPIKDFTFLGKFNVEELSNNFKRWVDTE